LAGLFEDGLEDGLFEDGGRHGADFDVADPICRVLRQANAAVPVARGETISWWSAWPSLNRAFAREAAGPAHPECWPHPD
jgi:hypothetical protein